MSRSQKKGPFVDEKLYRKVQKAAAAGSKEPIKTWARACTVIPEFVGYTFMIHDGRKHIKVLMTEDMVDQCGRCESDFGRTWRRPGNNAQPSG